jgi:hypothetical protein
MSLSDLASEGRFKAHKTSKSEINQLLAVFDGIYRHNTSKKDLYLLLPRKLNLVAPMVVSTRPPITVATGR